ncbi:hypothetical protein [Xenorhabdus bovienii]|uniref:hypothetical protein n=1 Tax=Xenorhabdus bovienii TaxID=40576 RepID=UPI003DA3E2E9
MSKDVIELAQEIKQLAIDMKYDRYDFVWLQTQIKDDWGQVSIPAKYFSALSNYHQIIRLCEAIEKLAEYENMEPVAWGRITGMFRIMDTTTLPVIVSEWIGFNESHPDIADDIFPLYLHPNK